ncbi:hypothetical protein KNV74_gp16 [Staphylococcus phage LSA2366]|uniref:Uncharacterized protein n=2 Tax=Rosenblumvirus TaxID=680287 RepID=A0A173G9K4_9CAUD|nr:hypothetical protein BI069_gp06 [Staphylococcus phage SLPW]YP_010114667.1 hypothetical protein KNV74_gp16 [Staphylococcus phage LSA2366]ANH49987.1 hypothetical protein [Staphylococcus phage SLPW]QQO38239.1 hypothetical protein LSA2366_0016 [Staphylococcus phage LSA2366]
MVRRTSAMDRWVKQKEERRKKEEEKKKKDFTGVDFKFDDVDLQNAYIEAWEKYSYLPHFPKDKNVSYVLAKSLVSGKHSKQLNHIISIYERNDDKNNINANFHKNAMINIEAEKHQSSISRYIKGINDLFNKIGYNDRPMTTIDDVKVRYNFLFYAKYDN